MGVIEYGLSDLFPNITYSAGRAVQVHRLRDRTLRVGHPAVHLYYFFYLYPIVILVNRDRLQYTCIRLLSPDRNCGFHAVSEILSVPALTFVYISPQ